MRFIVDLLKTLPYSNKYKYSIVNKKEGIQAYIEGENF